MKKVIIIGAGYGGMALANLLAKKGYEVHVFEKNEHLGGRISAVKQDNFVFDIGPSWYLMPEVFEQYYDLFGESAEKQLDLVRFSPGFTVFSDTHRPIRVEGDIDADAALFESIEAGAGEALRSYVKRSTVAYELSLKHFLYNNFHNLKGLFSAELLRAIPRLIGLVSQSLDAYVSRYFSHKLLKQLLEYQMVFLGSSPFQAPAIYSLMSHLDYVSGVFYPKGGILSLATDMKRLGEKNGVTYHTGTPVKEIIVRDGSASGIVLDSGEVVDTDIVVSNADLHFTETSLLAPEWQTYPQKYWDSRQPGPGALLVSLGVKGALPQLTHHNLYFVDEWKENFEAIYEAKTIPERASIYICNPSKTDPALAPKGSENLFILVPIPSGVTLDGSQQEKLADAAVNVLEKCMPGEGIGNRIISKVVFGPSDFASQYNSWEYNAFGGESHILRQSIFLRTRNASRKVRNLHYVGAGTTPGVGLPMCLISAQLTYKNIVGDKTPGPIKWGSE